MAAIDVPVRGLVTSKDETNLDPGEMATMTNARIYRDGRVAQITGTSLIATKTGVPQGYFQWKTKEGNKYDLFCYDDRVEVDDGTNATTFTMQSRHSRTDDDPSLQFFAHFDTSLFALVIPAKATPSDRPPIRL